MRKSLILMLIATLLLGAFLVSCNSDISSESSNGDTLVKVTIAGNTKGISAVSTSDDADNYYWYYSATKNDSSVYRTGQTAWKAVKNGTGLSGAELGYFSSGAWMFSFYGYTTAQNEKPTDPKSSSVYYQENKAVSVVKTTDTPTYVSVTLKEGSLGETATLVIQAMNWKYTPENPTDYSATLANLGDNKKATIHFSYLNGTNTYTDIGTAEGTVKLYTSAHEPTTTASDVAYARADFSFTGNYTIPASIDGKENTIKFWVTIGTEIVGDEDTINVVAYSGGVVTLSIDSTGVAVADNEAINKVIIDDSVVAIKAQKSVTISENKTNTVPVSFTSYVTPSDDTSKTTTVSFPADSLKTDATINSSTNSSVEMEVVVYQTEAAQAKFKVVEETTLNSTSAFAGLDLNVDLITTTTVDNVQTTTTKSISSFNNQAVTIKTYIAKGLSNVNVVYNGTDLAQPIFSGKTDFATEEALASYEVSANDPKNGTGYVPSTGLLVFKTTHFSEFVVGADQNVYDKTSNTAYRLGTSTDGDAKKGLLLDTANKVVAVDSSHEYLLLDNTKANDVADSIDAFNSNIKWSAVHAANDTPSTLFDGGYGTKIEPYLISSVSKLSNINEITVDSYFKVKDQNSTMNLTNWTPVALYGSFNGNGATINSDNSLFDAVRANDKAVIRDFTINANISVSDGVGAVINDGDALTIILKGITVHGTIIGANWVTPFVEFGPGPSYAWYVTFEDCLSDATLVATSGAASGFIGHPYDDVSNGSTNGLSTITIKDSAFTGSMSATGKVTGYNFKYFTINGNDNRVRTKYSEDFINALGYNPEGTLYATPADITNFPVNTDSEGYKVFFCGNYGKNVVDYYKPADKKATLNTTNQMTLPSNKGYVFTVTKVDGVAKAVASLLIAPNDSNNYGSYLGTYMEEVITISGSDTTFTTSNVKYFNITINDGTTSTSGVTTSGDTYNVVSSYYGHNAHNGATVKVVQYDSSGNVLNVSSLVIATPHVAE